MQQLYTNISPATGIHLAGIITISIAPKEWLAADPSFNFLHNTVNQALALKPGRQFISLNLLQDSYKFLETAKNADAGQYFDVEISGELNTLDPQVLQTLNTYRYHKFLAVVLDKSKRQRVIGNRYNGLTFVFSTANSNADGGEQRISISMAMQLAQPAPYLVL